MIELPILLRCSNSQQQSIKNIVRFSSVEYNDISRYKIDDLKSTKQFVVSARALACFDSKACSLNVPFLDNLILPKPLCNFNGTYKLPGNCNERHCCIKLSK